MKEDDYRVKLERLWCKKLGALCLIGKFGQKELIELAKDKFKEIKTKLKTKKQVKKGQTYKLSCK